MPFDSSTVSGKFLASFFSLNSQMGIRVSTLDLHNYLQMQINRQHALAKSIPFCPSMMDQPETCQKPPETGHGGFRQVTKFFIGISFFSKLMKKSRNLLETAAAGFQRFLKVSDNPSLTDHKVLSFKGVISDQACFQVVLVVLLQVERFKSATS